MIRGTSSGLPASGIARNFFAGGDSSPRLSSNGPAILTGIFPSQGHPFEARRDGWRLGNSADRARLYGGGESADLHPGLVDLPGSQSVLDPGRRFNRSGLTSAGEPCRRALSPKCGRGGIFNFGVTSDEFGDHARDGLVKRLPCVGSLHAHQHEPEPFHEARELSPKSGTTYACR